MKYPNKIKLFATLMIAGLLTMPVMTQDSAQERAAKLRQQLVELQEKQSELETRRQQLEEDLKPENIEKDLAGIGSTRPEELREQRRRKLEIEKKGVQKQLDQLAASRIRLETGIDQADVAAYHSSATPKAGGTEDQSATKQSNSAQPGSASSPTVRRRPRRGIRSKPRPRRERRTN
jgi:uncharacterized protein YlxW (UPF0749 family)